MRQTSSSISTGRPIRIGGHCGQPMVSKSHSMSDFSKSAMKSTNPISGTTPGRPKIHTSTTSAVQKSGAAITSPPPTSTPSAKRAMPSRPTAKRTNSTTCAFHPFAMSKYTGPPPKATRARENFPYGHPRPPLRTTVLSTAFTNSIPSKAPSSLATASTAPSHLWARGLSSNTPPTATKAS